MTADDQSGIVTTGRIFQPILIWSEIGTRSSRTCSKSKTDNRCTQKTPGVDSVSTSGSYRTAGEWINPHVGPAHPAHPRSLRGPALVESTISSRTETCGVDLLSDGALPHCSPGDFPLLNILPMTKGDTAVAACWSPLAVPSMYLAGSPRDKSDAVSIQVSAEPALRGRFGQRTTVQEGCSATSLDPVGTMCESRARV